MRRIAPLILAAIAAATLTACSSETTDSHPKPTSKADACKAAMADEMTQQQLIYTAGGVVPEGVYPSACDGLDDAALQDTAGAVLADQVRDDLG
jgi:entry exclusion lipoprotein TrbK